MDQNQLQNEADEIKAAMKAQRLSAAALHRKSGVSENTIGKVLKGVDVSDGTSRKLRAALGLLPGTSRAHSALSDDYPPNIIAVQLMVGAFMRRIPESQWMEVGEEVAATFLAHMQRVSDTGE